MKRGGYAVAVSVIALIYIALVGCISGTESVAADVSPEGWAEPVEMVYRNSDTLSVRKLHLALQYSATLEERAGRYAVEIVSPKGAQVRDTLTINLLPAMQGNDLKETAAHLFSARLAESGDYRLIVKPLQNVVGVWSVGIDFE